MQRPLIDPADVAAVEAGGSPGSSARPPSSTDDGGSGGSTSLVGTALNIANTLEGMGLLGLPYAVRLAGGYAFGAIAVVCATSCWTAVVIAATLYDPVPAAAGGTQQRGGSNGGARGVRWVRARTSYVENATAAFGPAGGVVTLVIQVGTLVSVRRQLVLVQESNRGHPDLS